MSYRNLSLLRKDELRTMRKSERDFQKELTFFRETSEVFLKTFQVLSDENVHGFTYSKDSTYRISYRIFRILRCAFDSSLKGYYDVSMALLRISYENHLLMNYLSKHEEEAKLWFEGKKFRPSFLRKNVSYASDSLYEDMCEFVHSSFKSTFAFTEIEKDKTKATLGEYNKERFKAVLFLMLTTMAATIIWLSVTFAQELMKNEEWHEAFRNTVPKMWKYLKELR
ncbi:hypothetical protein E3J74_06380 [Candidatus Bathyarchaeota archaeon]|nr:MAG: hypothetical protein E3J74_06380 [Candidatus Bathyarchaeota archaeon]